MASRVIRANRTAARLAASHRSPRRSDLDDLEVERSRERHDVAAAQNGTSFDASVDERRVRRGSVVEKDAVLARREKRAVRRHLARRDAERSRRPPTDAAPFRRNVEDLTDHEVDRSASEVSERRALAVT